MSYRDLRNFSEDMRVLGFPHAISLESFRAPNWPLLEACLRWLACRLEPGARLPGGADSLENRVAMVVHAVHLFRSRGNVVVSGRLVYGAEGWAVRELARVSGLVRAATRCAAAPPDLAPALYDVSARIGEIKQARTLATDITAQGAYLYDLLAKEPDNKEARERALSRPLDLSAAEGAVRDAAGAVRARTESVREQLRGVAAGEAALDGKLDRRRAELQRAEKRLHTVQKIKPAYQAEVSALQGEVAALWEQYARRYRCLEALKHHLSLLDATHNQAAEEEQSWLLQLIHKYESEDVLAALSATDEMESSEEDKEERQPRPATRPRTRLRIKTAGGAGGAGEAAGGAAGAGLWLAGRESLDIRDEDSLSDSEPDLSDTHLYGESGWAGRARSRPGTQPRPRTRTLPSAQEQYADLLHEMSGSGRGSRASSSDRDRLDLSDNEF